MVYIYKKVIGNKTYYYLRASEKKGKRRVTKDLTYLGDSIEKVRKALDNLPKYKDKIRKAYRTINLFLESNYYLEKIKKLKLKKDEFLDKKLIEIEACKFHYNKKFQKLDPLTKQEFFKNFIIDFAFNTTSIEGNTITLKQARNLLEEGFTPKNKTLREIYDLQNTQKVFLKLLKTRREITPDLIIEIQKRVLENIDKRIGYRTKNVRVVRARFKSSPAQYVKSDMNLLLKWYNEQKEKLHPLVLAILFHHKLEKIHPFMDGNGRVGRMLLNYILLRDNYPPLIIRNKFRSTYLDVLSEADKSNLPNTEKKHYLELVQFASDEMITSYWNNFLV